MHILLVEDDAGIVVPLVSYLENAEHIVSVCSDGAVAVDMFRGKKPTLVILDINLPWKNGIEICREIRQISKVPIIVLSARASEDDKVELLELGADDYVAKPFSARELVARIAVVAKRSAEVGTKTNKILSLGGVSVDNKARVATVGGVEVKFTKTEFDLLEYFIKNGKNVIRRESLMKDIIGYENYIYDRTIDTHVKNLRKKIWKYIEIETIRGVGYRVCVVGAE